MASAADPPHGDRTADRQAIDALIHGYCLAADTRDLTKLAALFHPDARISGGDTDIGLTDFIARARGVLDGFVMTRHMITTSLIALDGPGEASATSYFTAVHEIAEGCSSIPPGRRAGDRYWWVHGRYLDTFGRDDAGWRFRNRTRCHDLERWD